TLYGELDLSIIKEMPAGRKPIKTRIVPPKKRKDAYEFIKKELDKKHQAFVIFPIIEESDILRVKAATTEHDRLSREVFPDRKVGLLHGKLKKDEKESVMDDFRNKKLDVLVSTSVVEVGIDIPDATIMMIENAERFGLAQLHQFRGRVGRGEFQSYCLLFTDSGNPGTFDRLHAMENSNDGFTLAEKDLQIRGPGEVYGVTQSGYFNSLKIARLSDQELLKTAREHASVIIEADPKLKKHPELHERLSQFEESVHFE
ncbi:helicase-related protein, partial [Patescibacteria group bacterium]